MSKLGVPSLSRVCAKLLVVMAAGLATFSFNPAEAVGREISLVDFTRTYCSEPSSKTDRLSFGILQVCIGEIRRGRLPGIALVRQNGFRLYRMRNNIAPGVAFGQSMQAIHADFLQVYGAYPETHLHKLDGYITVIAGITNKTIIILRDNKGVYLKAELVDVNTDLRD